MELNKNNHSSNPHRQPVKNTTGKRFYSSLQMKQQVEQMHERYGDARRFQAIFNPELQSCVAREWIRAYTGFAPTLQCVAEGYNFDTAIAWLCIEIENINTFSGAKEKLSIERLKELAVLILTEYKHLKVTELQLFFHRLKCGQYGRFYQSVDPLFISASLLQFTRERRDDLARIRAQQEKQRQQKPKPASSGGITLGEYLQRKAAKAKPVAEGEEEEKESVLELIFKQINQKTYEKDEKNVLHP